MSPQSQLRHPRKTHLWLLESDAMVVCGLLLSFTTAEDWSHATSDLSKVTCRTCLRLAPQEWVARQAVAL